MLVFKARPRKDPSLSSALTPSQRRMMRTLREAREATQRALRARQAEIMRLLLHAPSSQIVRAVPTDKWLDVQAELGAELQAELIDAGRRVKLPPIQKATINYRFDDTRPEAAAWAAKEAGTLIQDITQDQLTFVRDVISRSELGEFTPVEAAQVFRQMEDGMGLTTQQSQWVENFRQQRITDGMERGLSYEAAEAASAKATGKYADRIYRYRTETIARTEIMRASNEGRNQAWAQGIEGGWIAPDSLKKWSVEIDGRECSICRPLGDLEPIPINASFPSGDPPVHPNCRCTVQLTDEVPQDIRDMTDEELEAEIDRLLSERQAEAMPREANEPWRPFTDFDGDDNFEARRAYTQALEDEFTETWAEVVDIPGARVNTSIGRDGGRIVVDTTVTLPEQRVVILRANRTIDPKAGIVHHSSFTVDREYQGRGIATRANARFFDLYRERGMKEVRLQANIDVGGYTWAKQGFDWNLETDDWTVETARKGIKTLTATAVERAEPESPTRTQAESLAARMDGDPEQWPTPLEISMLGRQEGDDTWLGKEILLGSSWLGRLEL